MSITPDSEVIRLEKRQRGLQRVATAINDLTIYGISSTNFPKLVGALEHSKDHIKAEIQATKKKNYRTRWRYSRRSLCIKQQ